MNSVHPGPNAGDGRVIEQSHFIKKSDKLDNIIQCAQCGWNVDLTKRSSGPSMDSPGITYTSTSQPGSPLDVMGRNFGFENWDYGSTFLHYRGQAFGKVFSQWLFVLDGSPSFTTSGITLKRETAIVDSGSASMHIGITDNNNSLAVEIQQHQSMYGGLGINYLPCVGKYISFSCRAKTSQANLVGCSMAASNSTPAGTQESNLHTGSGNWETLITPPVFIPSLPSTLNLNIHIGNGGGSSPIPIDDYYIDSCHYVEYLLDPVVNAGCPMCGTFNPRAIGRGQTGFERPHKSVENL